MSRRLDRYLLRETAIAWLATSVVLLLLLSGTIVTRYLSDAATGRTTTEVLPYLVGLSSLQFSVVILPFSLLIATLFTLGRLYNDNEMAAIHSAGMGFWGVARPLFKLALVVALITAVLSIQLAPWAASQHKKISTIAENEATEMRFVEPGKFSSILDGKGVFYAASYNQANNDYHGIFVEAHLPGRDPITLVAKRAVVQRDAETRSRLLVLQHGYRYQGVAGGRSFRITSFDEHGVRIDAPVIHIPKSVSALPLTQLLASDKRMERVELHWRLSLPFTVLVFALLCISVAHVRPRAGRYGRLITGLLLGVGFWNLLVSARYQSEHGQWLPPGLLLWVVQGGALLLVLALIAWREGGLLARGRGRHAQA